MSIARLEQIFGTRSGKLELNGRGERVLRWSADGVHHRTNLGTSSVPSRMANSLQARGLTVPGVGDLDPFGTASFHGRSEYAPLVGGGKLRTRTMGQDGWVRQRAFDTWWGNSGVAAFGLLVSHQ